VYSGVGPCSFARCSASVTPRCYRRTTGESTGDRASATKS